MNNLFIFVIFPTPKIWSGKTKSWIGCTVTSLLCPCLAASTEHWACAGVTAAQGCVFTSRSSRSADHSLIASHTRGCNERKRECLAERHTYTQDTYVLWLLNENNDQCDPETKQQVVHWKTLEVEDHVISFLWVSTGNWSNNTHYDKKFVKTLQEGQNEMTVSGSLFNGRTSSTRTTRLLSKHWSVSGASKIRSKCEQVPYNMVTAL